MAGEPDSTAPAPQGAGEALFAPGEIVGSRYRVLEHLGSGGMGHVYRVLDLELDREIALKTLYSISASPEVMRRFRREVRLASKITHPNVIRTHDLGAAGPISFLTMDLVVGTSVAQLLTAGPLPLQRAIHVARQTAAGLAAAHAAGVVHRDLKPANLLIGEDDRVTVADFGVAAETEDPQTSASAIVGTSAYMAPEQANGEAATPAADVYSLGLVLYEMLTGKVPLCGKGIVATALLRERQRPPSLRSLLPRAPSELDDLTKRMLVRDPLRRPTSAEVTETLASCVVSAPRPRRIGLVKPLLATVALVALATAAVQLRARTPHFDPSLPMVVSVDDGADIRLPQDLAFLEAAVPKAAFRALAAQMPGRVAAPGQRTSGVPSVRASLYTQGSGFRAELRAGRLRTLGEGRSPSAALDAAASQFVITAFPRGLQPTPSEERDRVAWGAPDLGAVDRIRRADVAYARLHDEEALALVAPLRRRGFIRPYLVQLGINTGDRALVEEAQAQESRSPESERTLFAAARAALSGNAPEILALLPPDGQLDHWGRLIKTWALAFSGSNIEALSYSEALSPKAELASMSARLAERLATDIVWTRKVDKARALTSQLPEEPRAWLILAERAMESDELGEAQTAIAAARRLGGEPLPLAEAAAKLAVTKLDPEAGLLWSAQLAAASDARAHILGLMLRYSSLVLAGRFDEAHREGLAIEQAVKDVQKAGSAGETTGARGDKVVLAENAFLVGDYELGRRLVTVGKTSAQLIGDDSYLLSVTAYLAALDVIEGKIDSREMERRIAGGEVSARALRDAPWRRESARLMVASATHRCSEIRTAAPMLVEIPASLGSLLTARCDLDEGLHDKALTNLQRHPLSISRIFRPAFLVVREQLLGEALVASGRAAEARPHLQRVVDLWGGSARPEAEKARRLLEDVARSATPSPRAVAK